MGTPLTEPPPLLSAHQTSPPNNWLIPHHPAHPSPKMGVWASPHLCPHLHHRSPPPLPQVWAAAGCGHARGAPGPD